MAKKMEEGIYMKEGNLKKALVAVFSVVFALIVGIGIKAYASQITTITGLSGNDATVTNAQGQQVNPDTIVGDGYTGYNISYNWSIPDGTDVSNGDTATVTLPAGMVTNAATTGNVYDLKGQVVGTIKFDKGASTGTITFNNALHGLYGKKGTLTVTAVKKVQSSISGSDGATWMINKAGWIDKSVEKDGVPTKIYWDVVVNPNGKSLKDVKVTDTIGAGQTYKNGSATFHKIVYSSTGESQRTGTFDRASVSVNGNNVTFDLGDIDSPVEIEYETTITSIDKNAGNIWSNDAQVTADGGFGPTTKVKDSATVNWGTGGTASGYKGKVYITKVDSTDKTKVLPGAVFELKDDKGNVVQKNIETDSQGKATINDLPDGQYQLVETKAPQDYELSSTPIIVTVSQAGNHEASVVVSDKKIQASSSSLSSSKSSLKSSSVKSSSSLIKSSSKNSSVKSSSSSIKSSSKSSSKKSSSSSIKSSSKSSSKKSSSSSIKSNSKSSSVKSSTSSIKSSSSVKSSTSSIKSSSKSSSVKSSLSSVKSSSKSLSMRSLSSLMKSSSIIKSARSHRIGSRSLKSNSSSKSSSAMASTPSKNNVKSESSKPTTDTETSVKVTSKTSTTSYVNRTTESSVLVTSWTKTTVNGSSATTVGTTVTTYSQSKISNKANTETTSVPVQSSHVTNVINNQSSNHPTQGGVTEVVNNENQQPAQSTQANQGKSQAQENESGNGNGEVLPQTGENASTALLVAGTVLVIVGSAVVMRKHKK